MSTSAREDIGNGFLSVSDHAYAFEQFPSSEEEMTKRLGAVAEPTNQPSRNSEKTLLEESLEKNKLWRRWGLT
jgi:hypothetical protein